MKKYKLCIVGNPNVGKSTIFNSMTKSRQHTGNWAGKTVNLAKGKYLYDNDIYEIIDTPGVYSLHGLSLEENITKQYVENDEFDLTIVVLDSTCLKRSMNILLQVLEITTKVIVCCNLYDLALKNNILINKLGLIYSLNLPVVMVSSKDKNSIIKLKSTIKDSLNNKLPLIGPKIDYEIDSNISNEREKKLIINNEFINEITNKYVSENNNTKLSITKKIDNIILSKKWNIIIMLLLLSLVFFITIKLANYPSMLLLFIFSKCEILLTNLFNYLSISPVIISFLIEGVFNTLATVVSVMLPPMAIFFPLFAFFEEWGLLPRIVYNLDDKFAKVGCSGRLALTMCMGLGCNASAITASRIIPSKKERLIAIITNNFMPCNGRLPLLFTLSSSLIIFNNNILNSFFSSLLITLIIIFAVFITFVVSFVLSKTILKNESYSLTLEMPEYRKPNISRLLYDSLINKTLIILLRAVIVATLLGAIIWVLNYYNLLTPLADFLNPFGKLIGLDGAIILAFILALPANEIVLPLIILIYSNSSNINYDISNSVIINTFINNNWNFLTFLSVMLFSVLHFPCSTTLITTYKETKSIKWTFASFIIPTIIAFVVCFLLNIYKLF